LIVFHLNFRGSNVTEAIGNASEWNLQSGRNFMKNFKFAGGTKSSRSR